MATTQQYSLRWNNYFRHLTYAMENHRQNDDFVDVSLFCDGRRIKAHKVVLSCCSSYFKEIFKENPHPHPVIIFKFIKYEDLHSIIDFMYQGEVNVQQEALQSFLQTAELLAVQGLTAEEKEKQKPPELPVIDQQKLIKTIPSTIRAINEPLTVTQQSSTTQTIDIPTQTILQAQTTQTLQQPAQHHQIQHIQVQQQAPQQVNLPQLQHHSTNQSQQQQQQQQQQQHHHHQHHHHQSQPQQQQQQLTTGNTVTLTSPSTKKRKITFSDDDDNIYTAETVDYSVKDEPNIVKAAEMSFLRGSVKLDMPEYIVSEVDDQQLSDGTTQPTSQDGAAQTVTQYTSEYEILTESEIDDKYPQNETENAEITIEMGRLLNASANNSTPPSQTALDETGDGTDGGTNVATSVVKTDNKSSTAETNLLEKGVDPYVFQRLIDAKIYSLDIVKSITEEDLNILFAKEELGYKIQLRHYIKEYQNVDIADNSLSSLKNLTTQVKEIRRIVENIPLRIDSSAPIRSNVDVQKFSVVAFINSRPFLKSYYTANSLNNLLTDRGRSIIVENAVKFYVDQEKPMKEQDFLHVANDICRHFSLEVVDTYYTKKNKYPSGKIYNFYKNYVSRLRTEGLFPSKKAKLCNSPVDSLETQTAALESDNKIWLKYYCEPWNDLIFRWSVTYDERKKDIDAFANKDCFEILTQWPAYGKSFGKLLVEADFDKKFGSSVSLVNKWDKFCEIFIKEAPSLIKDKCHANIIGAIKSISNKDERDAAIFDLISAAFPPTTSSRDKNSNKYWKASIADSQGQFILRVASVNDIQRSLDHLSTKLKNCGMKLQPLLVFCLDSLGKSHITGIFNDVKYEYESIPEGISNLLKLHFLFNIEYQKHSQFIWEFVQMHFFDIETEKTTAKVKSVSSYLKSLESF